MADDNETGLVDEAEQAEARSIKTLLFYEQPVPLNRDSHRTLRLRPAPGDYSFAAATNSIPLAAVEFAPACRDYPIVFAGTDIENLVPSVLVGLRSDENLFVDSAGQWAATYVPAFVRRYPFVLAEKPGEAQDFSVCVDEGYPGLGTEEGEPLFETDGKEGPFLQRALGFLGEFQGQMKRTQAFVSRLRELDLLQPKLIQVAPTDETPYVLQGFHVLDEARLGALTDRELRELLASGELAWIYAHLLSLANIERVSARLDAVRATVQ